MTVLDRIKSFFRRAKPVAKIAEEKAPEATKEKSAKITEPQKKVPRARRQKRAREGRWASNKGTGTAK